MAREIIDFTDFTEGLRAGGMTMTRRDFARRALSLGVSLSAVSALATACDGGDEQRVGATEAPGTGNGDGGTVTMVSYGGSYNENLRRALLDPFERESGIQVNLGENTSLAPLKLQVESGNVQWDLAELNGPEYELAVRENLLEAYDYDVIDTENVPEFAQKEFGIKYALFLFVIGWDQREISDSDAPASWADFWNTERFPAKRTLYERIDDGSILEAALMAEGVPFDEIYPLDVERALNSLERLGRENVIWHTGPQEAIQQLVSREVPLATTWNGRVGIARRDEGAEIGFTPNEAVVSGDYLVVPKGAPNAQRAFELLNFIVTNAEAGAEYSTLTHYAIANMAAIELIPPEVAEMLPTNPALEGRILAKDDAWWADNLESATQRFKEWQLGVGE